MWVVWTHDLRVLTKTKDAGDHWFPWSLDTEKPQADSLHDCQMLKEPQHPRIRSKKRIVPVDHSWSVAVFAFYLAQELEDWCHRRRAIPKDDSPEISERWLNETICRSLIAGSRKCDSDWKQDWITWVIDARLIGPSAARTSIQLHPDGRIDET